MEKKIIVCSGPSGVGKSTVLRKVMAQVPDCYFSVSATTRPPRDGEVDGVNYRFMTKDAFRTLIERGALWEYNEYAGEYYGTPAQPLEEALEQGKTVFLDVDPNGAFAIRNCKPDATLIFITAPSMEQIKCRLEGRGDTPPEKIKARLERAKWEVCQIPKYDYLAVNNVVEECVEEVMTILRDDPAAENYRTANRKFHFKEDI